MPVQIVQIAICKYLHNQDQTKSDNNQRIVKTQNDVFYDNFSIQVNLMITRTKMK